MNPNVQQQFQQLQGNQQQQPQQQQQQVCDKDTMKKIPF